MKNQTLFAVIFFASVALSLRASDNLMHPILSISGGSTSSANAVTNILESAYTNNFVPHSPPRNDAQGFVPAVVSGDTGWSWSTSTPNQIKSTPSSTIFPNTNSAVYPVRTQAVTVFLTTATNNQIKTINALYYNKAGSTTSKSMVFNLIDMHKRDQLRNDFNNLAPVYLNSGGSPGARTDTYSRRIAVALLDWARYYPDFYLSPINSAGYINVTTNYNVSTGGFGPERASDHNGMAHEWAVDELKAFDAVYDSVVLTNLNTEMGFNVRDFIATNLFFNEGDFIVNHVSIDIAIQSNLSGPFAILPEVARVLDRPDYIIWMDAYLDATVRQKIRRDGALEEGEGYSIGYLNSNQDAAQNTHDYFLTRAATNAMLLSISNRALIFNTTLTFGQGQWTTVALPDGQLPSFGDTPFNTYFSARNAGNSGIMPAYGTLSLGTGSSSGTAVQLNENFSGDNNHMRADMCAFGLWTFSNEYLGNVRYYNGAIGRNFGEQMLAYNTVEIDRSNLTPYTDADTSGNGNLNIYETGNNGIALTEIDGQRSYSSKASRFQRLLILNTIDLTNRPYVVDVFRVTGGTTHDYMFHGSVRWTQTGQASFPLTTNNSTYPMLESGDAAWDLSSDTPYYGFWRGVSSNTAPGNFYLTYSDTNRSSARDTRLWMTADPSVYNVYLGWTPVPARDDTVPTNFFNSLGLTRPSAIIRHRVASGPLQDLFVSVIEPFKTGVSNIVSVQRLTMSNSLESVGLKVTFKDGRVDTYVINLRNPRVAGAGGGTAVIGTTDGQYVLNGRVGLHVDQPNGTGSRALTVNATDFKYPGRELITPANIYYSGWVAGETRRFYGDAYDAFYTTTPLPTGTALRNKFFSLTHGSLSGTTNISEVFKIDQVVLTNGFYHVCFTNDHQLEITNGTSSHEQVAPLRTFTTSNSFEIVLSAFGGPISTIADQNIPPGTSSGPINFSFGNLGTTSGSSLTVSASSADQTLVPNANLVITGSGTNRTLTITPAAGQTGSSAITVSTTDGTWTNNRTFNVLVANFAITTMPLSQSVIASNSVAFTNIVTATNGTGTVSFSVDGLPANATGTFNPVTTTGSGTNTLTVATATNTPAGTYPLTIVATTGGLSATSTVTLVVNVVNPTPGWSTWTGGSGTGNYWMDGANWSSPLIAGNSLAFGGISRLSNTNDTLAATIYSNIVFNPGAGSFTLNGNSITLIGGITNNSAVPQTVVVGINYANNITFNGASNALVIAGGLTNTINSATAVTITLAGQGTLDDNFSTPTSTNILLTAAGANWTIADNASSASSSIQGALNIFNGGTVNFGTADSAPTLTMTGTDSSGTGQRQLIGNGTGTSTLNIVNGTLTFNNRINVGNGTGGAALNILGGTLNIGLTGVSVADNNLATVGSVTVSNGLLHLTTGSIFVATRGTGTLTISGGQVDAHTLDVSRGIFVSGGTSSHGTVNLDGGILTADRITTATSSSAAGGSPTAILNLNGGLLKATAASATWLKGGSAGGTTPIPVTAKVKSGGAIIDDNGNAITAAEPLLHDAALGTDLDGGLNKLGSGTLTLSATNTYTGDTTVNAGILALSGNGSITNSGNLILVAGATVDASLRSDGKLTVVAGQTVSGNGTLAGAVALNGTLSPGDIVVGTITNNGSIYLGGGGQYVFDMADAASGSTNLDQLAVTNGLDVQSSSGNPFVIVLRSIDGDPNDGNPGAANFSGSSQSWPIIATAAGVTNFAASKFTVDNSAFQNDLAGGYFVADTNGASLALTFVPNNPPSANDTAFYLPSSGALQVPIASLAAHWTDPNGDPVQFISVNSSSANGANNVSSDANYIYYTGNAPDTIFYTVGDVRTNPPAVYRPGDTQLTDTGVIHILPLPAIQNITVSGSALTFSGENGIPGTPYYILSSTNVALPFNQWMTVSTNVFDNSGNFTFTNTLDPATPPTFYLLKTQ